MLMTMCSENFHEERSSHHEVVLVGERPAINNPREMDRLQKSLVFTVWFAFINQGRWLVEGGEISSGLESPRERFSISGGGKI
jgi:hypothetical protein